MNRDRTAGGVPGHVTNAFGAEDVGNLVRVTDRRHGAMAAGYPAELGGCQHGALDMDMGVDKSGQEIIQSWIRRAEHCDGHNALPLPMHGGGINPAMVDIDQIGVNLLRVAFHRQSIGREVDRQIPRLRLRISMTCC